jgi:hypothetical protein
MPLFPILPESAWLEYRGRPTTQGQNLTTHQALIAAPDGKEHRCYVKFSPAGNPMPMTEAIGWLIADALGLPRPAFAALIMVPLPKLKAHLPLDQHWMQYGNEALGFCCSTVDGKHITGRWRWLAALRKAKAFKHPDVARIAAFDTWAENQDRHTGNLLKTTDGGFVPIDNELIFYTKIWMAYNFFYQYNSLRKEARQMMTKNGYTKFESSMIVASDSHDRAFQSAWPHIDSLLQG